MKLKKFNEEFDETNLYNKIERIILEINEQLGIRKNDITDFDSMMDFCVDYVKRKINKYPDFEELVGESYRHWGATLKNISDNLFKNENVDLTAFDEDDWDYEEENEPFTPVLTESTPIYYVDEAEMIRFIELNSDMNWNKICDFIRDKGISSEEGKSYWDQESIKTSSYYNKDQIKWIGGFFKAHPWIKRMMLVF